MRMLIAAVVVAFAVPPLIAADAPLVEKYLHSGEYAKGEQALTRALAANPKDDQARFGLGMLQVFQGVNRLGQSLHEYGIKSENQYLPFMRLPIPKNGNPTPITYVAFRRVLEAMYRDLEKAEATLAGVTSDSVSLPLRLAPIRFDFDQDGQSTDTLLSVLKATMRTDLEFLKGNSEFLVKFDRGDVSWLRGYCHLLMSLLDLYLAFDLEESFDMYADRAFAQPKRRLPGEAPKSLGLKFPVMEPVRLGQFRSHLLAVCQLNKETWRHIRRETDDDHEWLPNAAQKSVIGLPVSAEQVEAWMTIMGELEGLMDGSKVIPNSLLKFLWPDVQGGLNLKAVLDDPPEFFDFATLQARGPKPKYLDNKGKDLNIDALGRAFQLFNNPLGMGYMAWFN